MGPWFNSLGENHI